MFGTEIHIATFIYLSFQLFILSFQIIYFLFKPDSKSRLRFFILTLLFFLYNIISGLVPDKNIPIEILYQNIVAWTIGISTATYFLHFIYKEHNIKPVNFLNIRNITYSTIIAFIILFLLPYVTTKNLSLSRNIFLVLPVFISIACLVNIAFFLAKDYLAAKNVHYKFRILCGGLGMMSIVALPLIILILGDNQAVEHSVFSAGYFIISFEYLRHQIYNTRIEQDLLEKLQKENPHKNNYKHDYIVSLYGLSSIEKEIMLFIIKDYNYFEISKEIYLSEDVILKHVSNIFRKTKIRNRAELMLLMSEKKEDEIIIPLVNSNHHEISKEITEEILESLKKFEQKKEFLKKGLSLKELAQKINTNTKYLSKTINDHKNLNFNTYINHLRINYSLEILQANPKLRKYNIKHLAEEVGFNNPEAFSRAFRNVTEKKPSVYIKELLDENE
ncbi:helix-turn-helix domain-containing protein [Aquimarina muelleri]|uniref:HTH araC/xylS-type domain-containing protein n=1 Tax=Aquimarina muelleri TaxID=279356 RepID=A0A918JZF1_9FLAO|nr:helix-turn-helix domain-containing protein [Aquimarina muelleri]MCX2764863.1 helix-turn-helix domain-containing protein [Aquimarina muelleri]GGX34269.1 hypothetical protein GCM10007384_38630 [Aquimarina muelleri]